MLYRRDSIFSPPVLSSEPQKAVREIAQHLTDMAAKLNKELDALERVQRTESVQVRSAVVAGISTQVRSAVVAGISTGVARVLGAAATPVTIPGQMGHASLVAGINAVTFDSSLTNPYVLMFRAYDSLGQEIYTREPTKTLSGFVIESLDAGELDYQAIEYSTNGLVNEGRRWEENVVPCTAGVNTVTFSRTLAGAYSLVVRGYDALGNDVDVRVVPGSERATDFQINVVADCYVKYSAIVYSNVSALWYRANRVSCVPGTNTISFGTAMPANYRVHFKAWDWAGEVIAAMPTNLTTLTFDIETIALCNVEYLLLSYSGVSPIPAYRSNFNVALTAGSNVITFKVAGVACPMADANYSLNCRVVGEAYDVISKTVNGFTISVGGSCTLDYSALPRS